jgi:hypothetical protein
MMIAGLEEERQHTKGLKERYGCLLKKGQVQFEGLNHTDEVNTKFYLEYYSGQPPAVGDTG